MLLHTGDTCIIVCTGYGHKAYAMIKLTGVLRIRQHIHLCRSCVVCGSGDIQELRDPTFSLFLSVRLPLSPTPAAFCVVPSAYTLYGGNSRRLR